MPESERPDEPPAPRGLFARIALARLLARFPGRAVWAVFVLVNSFVTIALLAGLAMITATPFVFPSLGPTAFLCFFTPTSPTASPRNTIVGHAIGITCGYAALLLVGLEHAPPSTVAGVDGARGWTLGMRPRGGPGVVFGGRRMRRNASVPGCSGVVFG